MGILRVVAGREARLQRRVDDIKAPHDASTAQPTVLGQSKATTQPGALELTFTKKISAKTRERVQQLESRWQQETGMATCKGDYVDESQKRAARRHRSTAGPRVHSDGIDRQSAKSSESCTVGRQGAQVGSRLESEKLSVKERTRLLRAEATAVGQTEVVARRRRAAAESRRAAQDPNFVGPQPKPKQRVGVWGR